MNRGAWWATVHRVAKSWTQLSDSHFLFLQDNSGNVHQILFSMYFRAELKVRIWGRGLSPRVLSITPSSQIQVIQVSQVHTPWNILVCPNEEGRVDCFHFT